MLYHPRYLYFTRILFPSFSFTEWFYSFTLFKDSCNLSPSCLSVLSLVVCKAGNFRKKAFSRMQRKSKIRLPGKCTTRTLRPTLSRVRCHQSIIIRSDHARGEWGFLCWSYCQRVCHNSVPHLSEKSIAVYTVLYGHVYAIIPGVLLKNLSRIAMLQLHTVEQELSYVHIVK